MQTLNFTNNCYLEEENNIYNLLIGNIKLNEAIIDLAELELQIKKNYENAIFTISNFIINSSKSKTNNSF